MLVTREKVLSTVAEILEEEKQKGIMRPRPVGCDKPGYRPSKRWWYSFLQRNPRLAIRTPDGKVEQGTQTVHHMRVSVGVNVSTQMPLTSLLEKANYDRTKFFTDDMALTNSVQVMDLLSCRGKKIGLGTSQADPPQVEVEEVEGDQENIASSFLSHHLSYPPSSAPVSPEPELQPASTSAVSPDLFAPSPSPPRLQEPTTAVPPLMSELMAMVKEMQGQLKELKEKQDATPFYPHRHLWQGLALLELKVLKWHLPIHQQVLQLGLVQVPAHLLVKK